MGQTQYRARVALGAALVLLAPVLSCMPSGSSVSTPPRPRLRLRLRAFTSR